MHLFSILSENQNRKKWTYSNGVVAATYMYRKCLYTQCKYTFTLISYFIYKLI